MLSFWWDTVHYNNDHQSSFSYKNMSDMQQGAGNLDSNIYIYCKVSPI